VLCSTCVCVCVCACVCVCVRACVRAVTHCCWYSFSRAPRSAAARLPALV
jgi:hypothetical protein